MLKGTLPPHAASLVKAATAQPKPASRALTCGWRERAWEIIGSAAETADAPPDQATAQVPAAMLLASAALHLPGLRQPLRRELRFARYDWLANVLPKVWWVTHEPLPPGSVIAGLGITAWSDLPALMAGGRRFERITVASDGRERERTALTSALPDSGEGEITLLRELPDAQPFDGWVLASYEATEAGRCELHAAQQWQPEEQRWGEMDRQS